MGYREDPPTTGEFFHIYNRGVEKRPITADDHDRKRWIETMLYYRFSDTENQFSLADLASFVGEQPQVEVVCYCLMPNHFHIVARQVVDGGISEWLRKLTVSYSRYFNTRHDRVGPLFQGPYKCRRITSTEDLLHVCRYVHLNPYVAKLIDDLILYPWSSFPDFIRSPDDARGLTLNQFTTPEEYQQFVTDFADYARSLHELQHLLIDA